MHKSSATVTLAVKGEEPEVLRIPDSLEMDDWDKPRWSSGQPVAVYEMLIKLYTRPTDLIFDPMMGMGTCAIAAIKLGRRWVGCEIDAERCPKAYDRIERETEWRRKDAVQG